MCFIQIYMIFCNQLKSDGNFTEKTCKKTIDLDRKSCNLIIISAIEACDTIIQFHKVCFGWLLAPVTYMGSYRIL